MSRPRIASVEAKLEIIDLKAKVAELEEFKKRIELGQKWLLCALYSLGGLIAAILACIQIFKELKITIG